MFKYLTTAEFNGFAGVLMATAKATLIDKGSEYAPPEERLRSFHLASEMTGRDSVECLDGMWVKHRVSIHEGMRKMIEDPNFIPSEDWIREKLVDNINYTLLLMGLIEERRLNETTNIQRHVDTGYPSDGKPSSSRSKLSDLDPDKADSIIKEHIQDLSKIYSEGGSSKRARACIDDFRNKWDIKVPTRAIDQTQNG